ncbi:MAG: hypothetical protein ABEK01_01705 [Candidatus Nanohaloarchaea archaeon]
MSAAPDTYMDTRTQDPWYNGMIQDLESRGVPEVDAVRYADLQADLRLYGEPRLEHVDQPFFDRIYSALDGRDSIGKILKERDDVDAEEYRSVDHMVTDLALERYAEEVEAEVALHLNNDLRDVIEEERDSRW